MWRRCSPRSRDPKRSFLLRSCFGSASLAERAEGLACAWIDGGRCRNRGSGDVYFPKRIGYRLVSRDQSISSGSPYYSKHLLLMVRVESRLPCGVIVALIVSSIFGFLFCESGNPYRVQTLLFLVCAALFLIAGNWLQVGRTRSATELAIRTCLCSGLVVPRVVVDRIELLIRRSLAASLILAIVASSTTRWSAYPIQIIIETASLRSSGGQTHDVYCPSGLGNPGSASSLMTVGCFL